MPCDYAIISNDTAIHYRGIYPDQAIIPNRAAVYCAVMGDGAMGANVRAGVIANMQHRKILNIGIFPNNDFTDL